MEIQYTLEALFIFGLGNWIALIIYISCCKAGRERAGSGEVGRGTADQVRPWQVATIF